MNASLDQAPVPFNLSEDMWRVIGFETEEAIAGVKG